MHYLLFFLYEKNTGKQRENQENMDYIEAQADKSEKEIVPEPIREIASSARESLLPNKSKTLYENAYNDYRKWCKKMKINATTEDGILAYFNTELSSYKISSLWTKYSMLRSTINLKEGVDISRFPSLIPYLKRKGDGYKAKKSLTLSKENVDNFLKQASDKEHLLNKVILIFGVAGACRRQEIASLETRNVEDCGSHFLVKLVDTKTNTDRSFIILPGNIEDLNLLELIRKYITLRSPKTKHNRFFVNYVKETCTVQPVGIHKIGGVPSLVAKFLKLENASAYTGHCFRRTSASILANAGASMQGIMRHGGWRSATTAEGYIDQSESSKISVASTILGNEVAFEDASSVINLKGVTKTSSGINIMNNKDCVNNINNYYNREQHDLL